MKNTSWLDEKTLNLTPFQGVLIQILSNLFYSSDAIFTKLMTNDAIPVSQNLILSAFVQCILYLACYILYNKNINVRPYRSIACSLILVVTFTLCKFAYALVPVGNVATISGLLPLGGVVVGRIFFREIIPGHYPICLALSLGGTYLVVHPKTNLAAGENPVLGYTYAFLYLFFLLVFFIYQRQYHLSPIVCGLISRVILFFLSIFFIANTGWTPMELKHYMYGIGSGISMFLGLVSTFIGVSVISVHISTLANTSNVVFTFAMQYLILKTTADSETCVGVIAILGSSILYVASQMNKSSASKIEDEEEV